MKNQKFLCLESMKLTTRIDIPGKDKLLKKEGKQSFDKALDQAKGDPKAKKWLEGHKDLW